MGREEECELTVDVPFKYSDLPSFDLLPTNSLEKIDSRATETDCFVSKARSDDEAPCVLPKDASHYCTEENPFPRTDWPRGG